MPSETQNNKNIEVTTRAMLLKTIKSQVLMKMPLMARLLLGKRMSWEGGKYITAPVDKAEMDDLGQSYRPGERLTSGRKTLLENPYFHWKYQQLPITYDVEEYLQNSGSDEVAPVKLIPFLVKKAQRAMRIFLYKQMWGVASTVIDSDHDKEMQSIVEAMDHSATYGHLSRGVTAATNSWWQSASLDGTWTDQDTAIAPSMASVRSAIHAVQQYDSDTPGEYLIVVGPTIFDELRSQVEAKHMYTRDGSLLAKYGFNSFVLDGVEVVCDYFLKNAIITGSHQWFFLLHVPDWEFRLHPQRAFRNTGFTWQGDKADGYDEWLARIMIAGNFLTWQPNKSCWRSAMAA